MNYIEMNKLIRALVVIYCCCIGLCQGVPPTKARLKECENIVADDSEGYNGYLTDDNSRDDYCCNSPVGFYVLEDCQRGQPTTTIKKKCPAGHYAEHSHGAHYCAKWSCMKDGRNYYFDPDSEKYKVTTKGTSTKNMHCRCSEEMYLVVEKNIDVGFCYNLTICGPGQGVSVQATETSNVKCMPCQDGYFQPSNTTTDTCKPHRECIGRKIKVHGNQTHNTECTSAVDKVVVTTTPAPITTTTETESTTEKTPTSTIAENQTAPELADKNHIRENNERRTTLENNHVTASNAFPSAYIIVIAVVFVALFAAAFFCWKKKLCCCVKTSGDSYKKGEALELTSSSLDMSRLETDNRSEQMETSFSDISRGSTLNNTSSRRHDDEVIELDANSKEESQLLSSSVSCAFSEEPSTENKAQPRQYDNVQPEDDVNPPSNRVEPQPVPSQSNAQSSINPQSTATRSSSRNMRNINRVNPQNLTPQRRQCILHRNEKIVKKIRNSEKCSGTMLHVLRAFATMFLSDIEIHDIFHNQGNEICQDKYSAVINKIFMNKGIWYTPEEFVQDLSNLEAPNLSLIHHIENIIRQYDAIPNTSS